MARTPILQPALTAEGDVLVSSGDAMRRNGHSTAGRHSRRGQLERRGTMGVERAEAVRQRLRRPQRPRIRVRTAAILSCIDLKDGTRKWKGGRFGQGQLVLLPDQDLLLVLSEEGELGLVSATPDKFTEVARLPGIEGKTWNHPVLVRDTLLVRNDQEMAAFRLPLSSR